MLAIFDVEGVLYDAEYLPILAEKINKEQEIWDITKKGIQGLINWEEGLKKRVELLKGISFETFKDFKNQWDESFFKANLDFVEFSPL